MSHFQLALVQVAVALIEQDVVDQILVAFLDQWLDLQPDQSQTFKPVSKGIPISFIGLYWIVEFVFVYCSPPKRKGTLHIAGMKN